MESKPLAANRVPLEPIILEVEQYLDAQENLNLANKDLLAPRAVLAEQARLKIDTFEKLLARRSDTMDFDVADKLLCMMDKTHLWWSKFGDIYWNVRLDDEARGRKPSREGPRVCARHACSNEFVPSKQRPDQKYCSTTCKGAAWKADKAKTRLRGPGRKLEMLMCVNGHERSPENTTRNIKGALVCRICKNEQSRRSKRKRYREQQDAA